MRQQHRAGLGGSGMLWASALCCIGHSGRRGAMHHKCDMQATTWVAPVHWTQARAAVCACRLLYSFPMGFVSDRLYAGISRREFTDPSEPGCFWTVSKVVHTHTTAAWAALNYPGACVCDNSCPRLCSLEPWGHVA